MSQASKRFAGPRGPHGCHTRCRHGFAAAPAGRPAVPPSTDSAAEVPPPESFDDLAGCSGWCCMEGMEQAPRALPLVRHILAIEAAGWHVVELRPNSTGELAVWHVKIERYDEDATMTLADGDLEAALEELLRYVQVDVQ